MLTIQQNHVNYVLMDVHYAQQVTSYTVVSANKTTSPQLNTTKKYIRAGVFKIAYQENIK
jgi:hypothetical protein